MRTQCRRIYSALPSQCDRICNGRCDGPCDGDASPEFRVQSSGREGPSLSLDELHREIWLILDGGLATLTDNDFGRPWPRPDGARIGRLVGEYPADLCRAAAREAREIVQAQDKAPNITSLFAKKLAEIAEVRKTVRRELAA